MLLNRFLKFSLILGVIIFLAGCGIKGPQFTAFNQPQNNESLLYIYRKAQFFGDGLSYYVNATSNDENKTIGYLRADGYLQTALKPNKEYEIWAKTEVKKSIVINTKPNELICIRSGLSAGIIVGRVNFEIVDKETCLKEIAKTKLSPDRRHKN